MKAEFLVDDHLLFGATLPWEYYGSSQSPGSFNTRWLLEIGELRFQVTMTSDHAVVALEKFPNTNLLLGRWDTVQSISDAEKVVCEMMDGICAAWHRLRAESSK